jgi:hypothetical protein
MDILTLELFDVTLSEALREVNRALEQHAALPLRILVGTDPVLRQNVQRLVQRLGRQVAAFPDGAEWRLEVAGAPLPAGPAPVLASPAVLPPRHPVQAVPVPPALPARPRPLLLTRAHLGQGPGTGIGRRLLLGVLRELDPGVPWLGLALEAVELLDDPQALGELEALRNRGVPVLVSRESRLFPGDQDGFDILEDSRWQRLAGRGEITIL